MKKRVELLQFNKYNRIISKPCRGDFLQIDNMEAKHIIDTLKNGVIPDTNPDLLCLGRDSIIKEMDRCLSLAEEGGGSIKFITGEYGSGKSFMLNKIRQQAIRRNFTVSRLQINKGFNLSNFDGLYYNIMHNLTTKLTAANGTDFEVLFNHWIENLKNNFTKNQAYNNINDVVASLNSFNSSYSRAFLTFIRARISQDHELANAAASWIKGEKNIPAVLKAKFDVKGDIDRHTSIDSLKAFVQLLKLIGYKGLVVLVDELELVMSLRSDIRKSCYENIRYILDNTFGGDFGNCIFVFAATDELFQDEERGIKTYHALYQRLGEALSKNSSHTPDMRQPVLPLARLSYDELLILSGRIIDIHTAAYSWKPSISNESLRNWTLLTLSKRPGGKEPLTSFDNSYGNAANKEKGGAYPINTREFIKKLVEILDILEQNPGYNLFNTELKIVTKNSVDMFVNVLSKREYDN